MRLRPAGAAEPILQPMRYNCTEAWPEGTGEQDLWMSGSFQ